MLYCETGKFAAVCSGELVPEHLSSELVELVKELAPLIQSIREEGEITLKVQHGWVSSIGSFVRQFRNKRKST